MKSLPLGFACRHFAASGWLSSCINMLPLFIISGQNSAQNDCGCSKYCWYNKRSLLLLDTRLFLSQLLGMNICAINRIFLSFRIKDCSWKPPFQNYEKTKQELLVVSSSIRTKTMQMFRNPTIGFLWVLWNHLLRERGSKENWVSKIWSVNI